MPSPLSYRPHYHRDWVSSTTVRCMSYAAIGIYLTLLDAQWEDGSIPENPQRMLRCTDEEWAEFSPYLDKCFPICPEGRKNARCHEQRVEATAKVEKNRTNSLKGGEANAKRLASRTDSRTAPERIADTIADTKPIPDTDTDTDTQLGNTPLPPKGGTRKPAKFDPLKAELPGNLQSSEGRTAWEEWISHLKHKGKSPTEEAVRRQLLTLSEAESPISWIQSSIERNYQSVYPPPAKHSNGVQKPVDRPVRLPA